MTAEPVELARHEKTDYLDSLIGDARQAAAIRISDDSKTMAAHLMAPVAVREHWRQLALARELSEAVHRMIGSVPSYVSRDVGDQLVGREAEEGSLRVRVVLEWVPKDAPPLAPL